FFCCKYSKIVFPDLLLNRFNFIFRLLFKFFKLLIRTNLRFKHPTTHFTDAIKFTLPFQALFRFITFMRSGSRMPLRLSHFCYMNHYRNMLFSTNLNGPLISSNQSRIIPAAYLKNLKTFSLLISLQPL